jgi:hypothetical protein
LKQTGAAGQVEPWNETYSSVEFTLRRNGTWAFYLYDTNYYNDKSMISSPGGRALLNYPEGVLLASGNWAQVPSSNFGDSYTVDFELEQYEWGWHDYPVIPASETNTVFSANTVRGSWTLPVSGGVDGLGTNIPVNTDVTVRGRLGLDARGNDNERYNDRNGALSHYARGIIKVTIKRGGVQVLQFRVKYCVEGRYASMKVTNSANTYTYAIAGGANPDSYININLPKGYRITGYKMVLLNNLNGMTVQGMTTSTNITKIVYETSSSFDICCNICTIIYHTIMPVFLSKQTIIHFHLYVSIGIVIRENVINRISLSEIIYICSNNLVIKIIINIYNTI